MFINYIIIFAYISSITCILYIMAGGNAILYQMFKSELKLAFFRKQKLIRNACTISLIDLQIFFFKKVGKNAYLTTITIIGFFL